MTPSRCTPLAFGLLHLGPTSSLVSGIAAWRSAGLAAGFLGVWLGAAPGSSLRSRLSSFPLLAGVAQHLVMVEL